ncbi:hypothetical protein M408DRAFT_89481 [Serendipita vermifera MAFF 305830]|uniref:B30.2/SPRY domain-containing protein n=1 Tax=Serendipita vermifera MAFF 305830 TaxID=933852 RepID=A0A0C2XYT5_SERVB|nr:hypothetical protein M408DRAFT_89481 [Serendipita vermifera MAFF 305830]
MPPPVQIPTSSSSSRLESALASLEDVSRQRSMRRDSAHPSNASFSHSATGFGASMTPPTYSTSHVASSSYQPRVIRASSSAVASSHDPISFGTRHSISPVRHRTHSSNLLSRPQAAPRVHSAAVRAQEPPFSTPAYLSHVVLSNLFHGGPVPPQAHILESRVMSEAPSSMTDSDESTHGDSHLPGYNRRRHRNTTPKELVSWPTVLPLPTQWNENDKSPHLTVSADGRDVSFNGHSNTLDTRDAAAVRADCPIPPACGIYYYEVTVLDRGNKGQISIGFATKNLNLSKLPGWDSGSWGYHGDDGLSFMGQPRTGATYGPRFGTNDTIGCGVNFLENNAFYTKNGKFLAPVFSNLPDHDLYPALGLRTANEHVRTNFGESPFRFDIDAYVSQIKLKVWREIQDNTLARCRPNPDEPTYQLDSVEVLKKNARDDEMTRALKVKEESLGGAMADLVLEYLMFQGYASTARQFHNALLKKATPQKAAAEREGSMEIDEESRPSVRAAFDATEQRARIMAAIVRGDIETAITLLKTLFPASLSYDGGLTHFKLRCRRFVELILEAYEAKRRVSKEAEAAAHHDVSGSGAVAAEGANAMDLDDETDFPLSPASHSSPWNINGSSGAGAGITPIAPSPTNRKGKQPTRRRSSGSRPSGSAVRATSRTRAGAGSLVSPMPSVSQEESSEVIEHMQRVLDYGTSLSKDWDGDERPFVREQLRRTVGLVAYEDPYSNMRSKELVAPEARLELAEEVNKAILATTVKSTHSSLERLYRQTGTTMEALGAIEVGTGAFVDVSRILNELV